jgi:hypothetical protein
MTAVNLTRITTTTITYVSLFCLSGPVCEEKGCPGVSISCSGHGYCTIADQTCTCDPYWTGHDCNTPDCPGEPDCNSRGRMIVWMMMTMMMIRTHSHYDDDCDRDDEEKDGNNDCCKDDDDHASNYTINDKPQTIILECDSESLSLLTDLMPTVDKPDRSVQVDIYVNWIQSQQDREEYLD